MTTCSFQPKSRAAPNRRGYTAFIPGPFDYGQLATDLAEEVRSSAERINASKKSHIIEVGLELISMKAKLVHGQFTEWIDRELNFSPTTARNYMRAAKEFADKPATVAVLPPATLYRLATAAPEIRADIVARAEAGQYLDREEVDEAIRKPKIVSAEAKKAAASETKARRRRERREQNWRAKWEADEREMRERQRASASELVDLLAPHFSGQQILDLYALWRSAGQLALEQALTEANQSSSHDTTASSVA